MGAAQQCKQQTVFVGCVGSSHPSQVIQEGLPSPAALLLLCQLCFSSATLEKVTYMEHKFCISASTQAGMQLKSMIQKAPPTYNLSKTSGTFATDSSRALAQVAQCTQSGTMAVPGGTLCRSSGSQLHTPYRWRLHSAAMKPKEFPLPCSAGAPVPYSITAEAGHADQVLEHPAGLPAFTCPDNSHS